MTTSFIGEPLKSQLLSRKWFCAIWSQFRRILRSTNMIWMSQRPEYNVYGWQWVTLTRWDLNIARIARLSGRGVPVTSSAAFAVRSQEGFLWVPRFCIMRVGWIPVQTLGSSASRTPTNWQTKCVGMLRSYGFVWKCWVYSQWNSHLIGIMIINYWV